MFLTTHYIIFRSH